MDFINTGSFLLWEWAKTLIIFSIIDMFLIKRKLSEVLKNPDTYISSLIVAAFLIIIRGQQKFSIAFFIICTIGSVIVYLFLKIIYKLFMSN